jgi:hypothetical protein
MIKMKPPCGGCPPCCTSCVFDAKPAGPAAGATVLLSTERYGCIRPDAGPLVKHDGMLGMVRGTDFHPVTEGGAVFLRQSGNDLAQHL